MFSETYYLLRSKADGSYLVARFNQETEAVTGTVQQQYLLVFRQYEEALSYLNVHGADVSNRFAVESIPGNQIGRLLERWSFSGVGVVQDPLIPRVEFLSRQAKF